MIRMTLADICEQLQRLDPNGDWTTPHGLLAEVKARIVSKAEAYQYAAATLRRMREEAQS